MTNKEMTKRLKTMFSTMTEDEIFELSKEALAEVCMESLKEKDCGLNFTGKCKKCYDYLAEQFILNYTDGKSISTVIYDNTSGKFYNTWLVFLGIARHIVKNDGKFHGIEDIIDNSGISRKTWTKFFDSLPRR